MYTYHCMLEKKKRRKERKKRKKISGKRKNGQEKTGLKNQLAVFIYINCEKNLIL